MATHMCRGIVKRISMKYLCSPAVLRPTSAVSTNLIRERHDKPESLNDRDSWVVFSDKGDTIICWHPEPEFPYEMSKPLPIMEPELREGDSALKVQYRLDDLHRYRPDGPTMDELMKITFTNKHRWYPHSYRRYKDKNPPIYRDGL